ncbi:hypothetical protein PENTCL1PPCAC_18885, partial [Pristionchus entomophagus]
IHIMSTTEHRIKIEKETLKKVTVFEDRAELKREFAVDLVPGLNEVIIERVSGSVNDDSVRVTGKGSAVIEEVLVADRRVTEGAGDSTRAKELRAEKEELEKNKRLLDDEKASLAKRIEALDQMIGQVGTGIAAPKEAKFSADQETLESVITFFDFYDKQVTELREKLSVNDRASQKAEEAINVKAHELNQIEHGDFIKVISILLDSTEGGKVELELTYQVWGANWHPFYDVRVDTKEGKTGMQLSYYGNVNQCTSEDWEGAQLTLSTARPCLGGNIPEIGTLDVSFYRPPPPPVAYNSFGGGEERMMSRRGAPMMAMAMCADTLECAPQMMNKVAEVNTQTLSTEFGITRPCSIPSDGANHKVTIGIVSLEPQLFFESVPTKNSSAFLTASALNSSPLPLLAGQASIYLDGAFVAKTQIKAVSPGERFTSSLGVDPAVKIDYKPAHKYHEQSGLINKSSSTITEQKIIVKNTRGDAVLLTIREQIPRSTDEKIKVKVIAPEAVEKVTEEAHGENHTPKAGVRLLPSNNLEWTVKLGKGENQTLIIKYAIEHPSHEKLEFAEKFDQ